MKKLILLVAIVATGLVSAKEGEKNNPTKDTGKKEIVKEAQASETDDPEGRMQCYEYAMYIPCRDFYITDTQCWGPGSGTATWDDAWICISQNGANAIDFFCGT